MPAPRRSRFWREARRRGSAGLALLAYLVAAGGLPVPAAGAKAGGIPFPCQDHPCGCATAEQCWRHCCCFTPAQRWAWAAAHHVEPPAYAERPDADVDHDHAACCAHRHEHSAAPDHDAHACCNHDRDVPGSRLAPAASVLRCRGAAQDWLSVGAVLPPPAPLSWAPSWPPAGRLADAGSFPVGPALPPALPPPRPGSVVVV